MALPRGAVLALPSQSHFLRSQHHVKGMNLTFGHTSQRIASPCMLQETIRQRSLQSSRRRLKCCIPLPPSGDPAAMLPPPMPQVQQCHSERRKGASEETSHMTGAKKGRCRTSAEADGEPEVPVLATSSQCHPWAHTKCPLTTSRNVFQHGPRHFFCCIPTAFTTGDDRQVSKNGYASMIMFMSERPITHLIESSFLPVGPQSSRMSFFIAVRR